MREVFSLNITNNILEILRTLYITISMKKPIFMNSLKKADKGEILV